mmetsp:Transcript_94700/g.192529  ORF Transcript_94700/g.192529 Transcript_94700/m.192529 type:complete len:298 (+) Transcript_94700:162-1055(+)
MPSTDLAKVSSLATDIFNDSLKSYIDYSKPDPIARRQLESWKLKWSEGYSYQNNIGLDAGDDDNDSGTKPVEWSPENSIEGTLEISGDYVAVTIHMKCIWTDGKAAKDDDKIEDGRLSYTCRVKSGRLIEEKKYEDKTERKIRKKIVSRLRQDSYIARLLGFNKGKESAQLCLAEASIYVNAKTYEMEERVDISEIAAEALRRALWSSTTSTLDTVEVILSLPSLPCRSVEDAKTTTRLANRAKLRLLEDAMLDECEKEGDDQLIEDLNISQSVKSSEEGNNSALPSSSRKNKKVRG